MPSIIVTLSGASGVGKSTIARELLRKKDFTLVPSNTTRKPRESDLPGEYNYLTESQFDDIGTFAWQVNVHGIRVGTRTDDLDSALAAFSGISLMLVTPDTLRTLLDYAPQEQERVYAIYLYVRSRKLLLERLRGRGSEDEQTIARRLEDCKEWDKKAKESGLPFHFVSNDGIPKRTAKKIVTILSKIRP
jgi:guanylate kinase